MKQLLLTSSALLCGLSVNAQDLPQAGNPWFAEAQAAVEERLARQPNVNRARNIIVLIADGNGVGTNYATRLYAGQTAGGYGDEHVLSYEAFPNLALAKTYNTNAQTPDSAGTATAIHSGVKTRAGVIGVDQRVARGDCSAVAAGAVANAAEVFSATGRAVGIVSTARITHATPATAYAHSADRNFEDDSKLPEGCETPDIATQLIDAMEAGIVDVAMGGGRRHFAPTDLVTEEGKSGRRTDGVNLIARAGNFGAQYAWNSESFEALALDGSPVLGLFHDSHMMYENDRRDEPSLAEMTAAAITALSTNEEGFFLTVEAGRVDHANHDGNLHRAVTDGAAFAAAVAIADELTDDEDTLIIVTADHEHAIAFNGYCGRGSPITGLCYGIDGEGVAHNGEPQTAQDGRPYTVAGYLNGPGHILHEDMGWIGARPLDLDDGEVTGDDYLQQALIPTPSETHSGEDVAVYAKGPWAHLVDGTMEQNILFHIMNHAASVE